MPGLLTLRPMSDADIPLGLRLSRQAGWNQIEADWRRMRDLEPEGGVVAEWDGVPVGTTIAVTFGPIAWIAMVLVDEAYRGRGIARRLMATALEWLDERGVATVRLDATPLGQPVYERLGFQPQFELQRWDGTCRHAATHALEETTGNPGTLGSGIEPTQKFREFLATRGKRLTQERATFVEEVFAMHEAFDADQMVARLADRKDGRPSVSRSTVYRRLQELVEAGLIRRVARAHGREVYEHGYGYSQYEVARSADPSNAFRIDADVTHTDRRKLLQRLFADDPTHLHCGEHGYGTWRRGALADFVGPCLADADTGPVLLRELLRDRGGRRVFLDIPRANPAAEELAREYGLQPGRVLTRMVRGTEVHEDLARFWASSGPELG